MRAVIDFSMAASPEMIELRPPPAKDELEVTTRRPWDKGALAALREIPSFVQSMVVEMVEDIVQEEGGDTMTRERFLALMKQYAPKEVMERFED